MKVFSPNPSFFGEFSEKIFIKDKNPYYWRYVWMRRTSVWKSRLRKTIRISCIFQTISSLMLGLKRLMIQTNSPIRVWKFSMETIREEFIPVVTQKKRLGIRVETKIVALFGFFVQSKLCSDHQEQQVFICICVYKCQVFELWSARSNQNLSCGWREVWKRAETKLMAFFAFHKFSENFC